MAILATPTMPSTIFWPAVSGPFDSWSPSASSSSSACTGSTWSSSVAGLTSASGLAMVSTPTRKHEAAALSLPTGANMGMFRRLRVSVVAPGGGTVSNKSVYAELSQDPRYDVEILGQSRAPYDRYPEGWSDGRPAPNLRTFAEELLSQTRCAGSDCLVVGSRGGQVVLPAVWRHAGDLSPPAVVINGGCTNVPQSVYWPRAAVSFLLVGGQDHFRGNRSVDAYLAATRNCVPQSNATTAILFVDEMTHMPQASLLRVALPLMLTAVTTWKASSCPPQQLLRQLALALGADGWSGRLLFTRGPGEWAPAIEFGSQRFQAPLVKLPPSGGSALGGFMPPTAGPAASPAGSTASASSARFRSSSPAPRLPIPGTRPSAAAAMWMPATRNCNQSMGAQPAHAGLTQAPRLSLGVPSQAGLPGRLTGHRRASAPSVLGQLPRPEALMASEAKWQSHTTSGAFSSPLHSSLTSSGSSLGSSPTCGIPLENRPAALPKPVPQFHFFAPARA